MQREVLTLITLLGAASVALAQEWNLEALKERTQSQQARLEAMREQVFLRYGPELGYESADEVPIMDHAYEELKRKVERIEAQLAKQREQQAEEEAIAKKEAELEAARAAQARREAELAAEEAERKAQKEALARQRAMQEAQQLAAIAAPFREALGYYRQKQYDEAYDRFIKLYFERDDSVPVGFYTGRSAFETRRYEIATGAYQQVLALDSDHRRARLELARTYYVMGHHQEARAEFERVLEDGDLPPQVEENIHAYLASIEAMQKRHHLQGQLIAGVGYDTNVNQGNDYLPEWLEPFMSDPVNPSRSDSFLTLVSANTHRYDFGLPGGWQLKSDLTLMANRYSKLSGNNLLLMGLKSGPMADLAFGRIVLPVGYEHVQVDGAALVDLLSVATQWQRPFGRSDMLSAGFKWLDRQNADSANSDRDATGYEFSAGWQRVNEAQNRLIDVGLLYISEAPKSGDRPDAEFTTIGLRGGYSWLYADYSAGVSGQYKQTDFPTPFVDVEPVDRADQQLMLGLNGSKTLQKAWVLSGQLSWIDNSSSYAPYDYSKSVVQVNMGWSWGL